MNTKLQSFFGPRVPSKGARWPYRLPSLLFTAAALCLIASMFVPYWNMTLNAPQYPKGLTVWVSVNSMEGDVAEIDGLNHYIGMRPLGEAAQLERRFSVLAISALALLVLAAVFVHTKWAAVLAIPSATVPPVFLLDMYLWMRHFGMNLDPTAALSSSIKPFVPPILGTGMIAQFSTTARADWGLYLATAASILILTGLYFHRKAYKPLVEKSAE
ncbi:MAG: cytochrome C [Chloroflexi bacterium]|nr:cytochrome C [Chloroflexota bacterium]